MTEPLSLDRLETLLESMEPADIRAQYREELARKPRCEAMLAQFERMDDDLGALKQAEPAPRTSTGVVDASWLEKPDSAASVVHLKQRFGHGMMGWALPLAAVVVMGLLIGLGQWGRRDALKTVEAASEKPQPRRMVHAPEPQPSDIRTDEPVEAVPVAVEEETEAEYTIPEAIVESDDTDAYRAAPKAKKEEMQTAGAAIPEQRQQKMRARPQEALADLSEQSRESKDETNRVQDWLARYEKARNVASARENLFADDAEIDIFSGRKSQAWPVLMYLRPMPDGVGHLLASGSEKGRRFRLVLDGQGRATRLVPQ
jgi:chemotaxis protein histidine kinase CheA